MEYSNEDYVKQFLILLGYVMIFCFIYLIKYIFFDLPNELKKWSPDPDLDNIIKQLKRLKINKEKFKILEELNNIKNDIECMTREKYIDRETKLDLFGIIYGHEKELNKNQKKIESNKEIIKNLQSLIEKIKNFRIKNHPFN